MGGQLAPWSISHYLNSFIDWDGQKRWSPCELVEEGIHVGKWLSQPSSKNQTITREMGQLILSSR